MSLQKYAWVNGEVVETESVSGPYFSQGLNYGACVYDGIRVYKTANGPVVFRLQEHIERFFHSASVLRMELGYAPEQLENAILELIRKNKISSGYVRSMAFYDESKMGIGILGVHVTSCILAWDWDESSGDALVTAMFSKYEKLSTKNVDMSAKISGYYAGALLAYIEAKEAGFDLPLLLDRNGNIAEGAINNFFVVKDGVLYTSRPENVLTGVTRDTILKIAPDLGIKVTEIDMKPEFLKTAEEAFFTGTGTQLLKINEVEGYFKPKSDEMTDKIQNYFSRVAHGEVEKYRSWLTDAK